MDEGFELPVNYKGQQSMFSGQLHLYGYSQKMEILIHGVSVLFERDEERQWRAIVPPEQLESMQSIDRDLLQAISDSIEEVLK